MWQDRAGSSWVISRAQCPPAPPTAVLPQQTPGVTPPIPLGLCGSTKINSKLRVEIWREGVDLGGQIHLGVPEAVVISFGTQVWAVPLAGPAQTSPLPRNSRFHPKPVLLAHSSQPHSAFCSYCTHQTPGFLLILSDHFTLCCFAQHKLGNLLYFEEADSGNTHRIFVLQRDTQRTEKTL